MAPLKTLLRRYRRSQRGAELIEFALTFPILLLIALGLVDFGFMFQQYEVLTNAAREGARIAVLPDYSSADAEARVDQYISSSFLSGDGTVTTAVTPGTVDIGGVTMSTRTVTVTYPHEYLFLGGIAGYFGSTFGTQTLTASSTMRVEAPGEAP